MEDPAILVTILKVVMMLVMIGAAAAVGRELVAMARGRSISLPASKGDKDS